MKWFCRCGAVIWGMLWACLAAAAVWGLGTLWPGGPALPYTVCWAGLALAAVLPPAAGLWWALGSSSVSLPEPPQDGQRWPPNGHAACQLLLELQRR